MAGPGGLRLAVHSRNHSVQGAEKVAGPGGAQASCPFTQPFGSGDREGGGAGGGAQASCPFTQPFGSGGREGGGAGGRSG